MNLVYYYPMKDGAPSSVARNIFDTLYLKRKELPFQEIILYTESKSKYTLSKKYNDIKVYSIKEIFKINKEDIIHIPVSPFIFPNSKLFLHVFTQMRQNKLILNYHGDLLNEVILKFKHEHKIYFFDMMTCIFLPILLSNANKIIVNSTLLSEVVKNRYGLKSVEVVPNAIDDYWYLKDNYPVQKNNGGIEIFYHGRLSPEKGVELLIKAVSNSIKNRNLLCGEINLIIAGDGSQRRYLENLSRELGIFNKVVFMGNVDKKIIKYYLKKTDVAIYPSVWDNFPLSIMEALASAECPVFFSKKAGLYDFTLIDGYELNAFEPSLEKITDIIQSTLENKNWKDIIDKQKMFANKYKWSDVIDHYIKTYNEIAVLQRD